MPGWRLFHHRPALIFQFYPCEHHHCVVCGRQRECKCRSNGSFEWRVHSGLRVL